VADDPAVRLLELPRLVDHTVEPVEQPLLIKRAVEVDLQIVKECRVDLHLVHEEELEVVLGGAQRSKTRLPQKYRRRRLPTSDRLVVPRGEAAGDRKRLQPALFEVLLRLVSDRPKPTHVPLALLHVGEERGRLDRLTLKKRRQRRRRRARQVKRPGLQVPEAEKVIPAA
jgi:hypothetical protein